MNYLLGLVMSTTYESHSLGEWKHLVSYQEVDDFLFSLGLRISFIQSGTKALDLLPIC